MNLQIFRRVGAGAGTNGGDRPLANKFAARGTASGAEVDYPVGAFHDVSVVFYDNNGVALVAEL